jgi:hypothetical protein
MWAFIGDSSHGDDRALALLGGGNIRQRLSRCFGLVASAATVAMTGDPAGAGGEPSCAALFCSSAPVRLGPGVISRRRELDHVFR